jgi:hypothetical protein
MILTSKSFKHGGRIPSMFTVDGKNISPQLEWSNASRATKSFALTCIDPDCPSGDFVHWIVYDIPADVSEIPQAGKIGKGLPNSFGKLGYKGPSPPSGTHRYVFTLYALDIEHIDAKNFFKEIEKHKLDSVQLVGLYERTTIR